MDAPATARAPDVPLVVGVTGHRNLDPAECEALRAGVRDFFAQLRRQTPDLPLVVLSSLAEGSDQLVAREALAIGARLVAPLPLPVDAYAQDFADAQARGAFETLCAQSDVLVLPLLAGHALDAVAQPGAARDRQYAQAGVFVASHCHVLLALWDGREPGLLGGTGQVVRYALDGVMPGLVEAKPGGIARVDVDESLVHHLACSRLEANGTVLPPMAPLAAGQSRWLSQKHAGAAGEGIPEGFRRMFARMRTFEHDRRAHAAAIASNAADDPARAGDEVLDGLLHVADTLAMHFQKRVLLTMRGIHWLAALTGISFLVYSELPPASTAQAIAIYGFIALFALGGVLAGLARRRDWHRKYVDYRALAEGLRVQRWWRRAGVVAQDASAFAHEDFMQEQDLELGWIRNVMRAAGIDGADDPQVPDAALEATIADWIGGQLDYYARKSVLRQRLHARAHAVARGCLWGSIAIAACLALFQRWLDAGLSQPLVAAMGVLAIVAAARESYAFRKGDKELAKQYTYMHGLYGDARRRLDAATDGDARRDILRGLGQAALAEHSKWALLHRERPLENARF